MYAEALKFTSSTGGTGALSISRVTGFPMPSDVFGSSGSRMVEYEIAEYADATMATLSKYEMGLGSLNLAAGVLTRSTPLKTWDGTTYNASNATALSFGTTAANIAIMLGASTVNTKSGITAALSTAVTGASDQWQPFNTRTTYDSNNASYALVANLKLYVPIEYIYTKPISQVALDIVTAGSAGTLMRLGLYDVDPVTGGPANLITEFTSAAQIDVTTTGYRPVTMPAPVWTPPGIYWLCMVANGAVSVRTLSHFGHSLINVINARDVMFYDKSVAYGSLPAVAETTLGTQHTRSNGGQPTALYR